MYKVNLKNLEDGTDRIIWVPILPTPGCHVEVYFARYFVELVTIAAVDVQPSGEVKGNPPPVAELRVWPESDNQATQRP
jgi:hypothetical protein